MDDLTIKEICKVAHQTSVEKGFYDNPPTIADRLLLTHCEISEAAEEVREDRLHIWYDTEKTVKRPNGTYLPKPEGVPVELADAIIRICDMADYLNLPLERALQEKLEYNKHREYKHGGKRFA